MTTNVVPRPTVLSAATVPPWSLMTSWTRERPIPLPSCVRPFACSTRWNRSKRRGDLGGGDAGAGVADPELGGPSDLPQRDGQAALEGELEGVGEQVQDDLLPHLAVDVDRPGQGGAVHLQPQAGPLARRAEAAGQVGGEGGEVGGPVRGPGPPRLDPGEVQQGVDQPEQPQPVAVHDLQEGPVCRRDLALGPGQDVLDRTEHQGQRGAELVADVGEEGGLGPIELGQLLGPAALLLVGPCVGDGGGHLPGQQVEEAPIPLVERPAGADARDDEPGQLPLPRPRHRQNDRPPRRLGPGAARQGPESFGQVIELDGLAHRRRPEERPGGLTALELDDGGAGRGVPPQAGRPGQGQPPTLGVQQVEEGEGQVMRVAGQDPGGGLAGILDGPGLVRRRRRQLPERPQPPLADGPVGVLGDDAEHPADPPPVVRDGAVREGMIRLLGEPPPLQEQEEPLVPGRPPRADDRLGPRADVAPDLGPDVPGRPSQGPGMLRAEGHPGVSVVIEEGEVRPPAHPHGIAGLEHDPDHRPEELGPTLDRAERGAPPVERPGAFAHLAPPGEGGYCVDLRVRSSTLIHGLTRSPERHPGAPGRLEGIPSARVRSRRRLGPAPPHLGTMKGWGILNEANEGGPHRFPGARRPVPATPGKRP